MSHPRSFSHVTMAAMVSLVALLCLAVLVGGCQAASPQPAVETSPAGLKPVPASAWPDNLTWARTAPAFFVAPDGKPDNAGTAQSPWDIFSVLAQKQPAVVPGSIVWMLNGVYGKGGTTITFTRLAGTEEKPIIFRQYPGQHATYNGGLRALGPWVWFWGYEITNTSTLRDQTRPYGLDLQARGQRAINLIVHDAGHPPIGFWQKLGDGAEVHGCVLWANGCYDNTPHWKGAPRGSLYMQNDTGTRYVTNNIVCRAFTVGAKAYTQGGQADGFYCQNNIFFDNPDWNLFCSDAKNGLQGFTAIGNCTYRAADDMINKPSSQFGYSDDHPNTGGRVEDNVFVAGGKVPVALHLIKWTELSMKGNTFIGGVTYKDMPGDANMYPDNKYLTERPSKGLQIFVFPNKYESGRGHVAVYNWGKAPKVELDLSTVLTKGQRFEIRDAQNYFGKPVAAGTYKGSKVSVSMNLTEIAKPIGETPHLVPRLRHTAPEFAAFVVIGEPMEWNR